MLLDGKARRPVEGIKLTQATSSYHFLANLNFLWEPLRQTIYQYQCSGQVLLMQYLAHSTSSSRFPLNFKPLHFSHSFSWSTVYSSASLSNLDPGMPSSSVRTVQDWSELLSIHVFFPRTLTEFDFVCLSHDGGQNFVTSLVQSAIEPFLWSTGFSGLRFPNRYHCASGSNHFWVWRKQWKHQNWSSNLTQKKRKGLATSQSALQCKT